MAKKAFRAELLAGHKGAAVLVPFDPAREWSSSTASAPIPGRLGHPVRGTVNGARFDGWIGKRWGRFFILVDAALQKAAACAVGDQVEVVVEPLQRPAERAKPAAKRRARAKRPPRSGSCLCALLAALLGAAAPGAAQSSRRASPEPRLARTIPLPGVSGRIDHLAFDPGHRRLWVAALGNGSVEVLDVEKGTHLRSLTGLEEPQGIAFVAATDTVAVACGGGSVHAFAAGSLEARQPVRLGSDADNVRLLPGGTTLLVGYGSGALALLDAKTLAKLGETPLPAHPESFQVEPGGTRAFVNVPGSAATGAIAVVDLAGKKLAATWRLRDAARNFPMALDAPGARLYVGCRVPPRLVVLDTASGAEVASHECVGDADDLFVDPDTGRILVIGGGGAIDVFTTDDRRAYHRSASIATRAGARTGLLVPARRALYVAVPAAGGQPAEVREYLLGPPETR